MSGRPDIAAIERWASEHSAPSTLPERECYVELLRSLAAYSRAMEDELRAIAEVCGKTYLGPRGLAGVVRLRFATITQQEGGK